MGAEIKRAVVVGLAGVLALSAWIPGCYSPRIAAAPGERAVATMPAADLVVAADITSAIESARFRGGRPGSAVDIVVVVVGLGDAVGPNHQRSFLRLAGTPGFIHADRDVWHHDGGRANGWPQRFVITASYEDYDSCPVGAFVRIKVTVDDRRHREHGAVVYEQLHTLGWECTNTGHVLTPPARTSRPAAHRR